MDLCINFVDHQLLENNDTFEGIYLVVIQALIQVVPNEVSIDALH